ncbi:MAG: putative TetR-family transcriptional regulator [Gammaproteobacteria bacterium]|jgi:AcrR family transcriptional regulator|nr:putative TetR-family transcriptional regulator [Gammaproteobacteria bacterium]
MQTQSRAASGRQVELLERAYAYVLQHGLTSLSLRPLAQAIGSSPRVLLFLFGSKEGLVQALLARARTAELEFLNQTPPSGSVEDFASVVRGVWQWLVDKQHRRMLALWLETYAQSLVEPSGPCADFARKTVDDWLELLAARQPASLRRSRAGATERALALAVLRGALLDLLATGDEERTTAAVEAHLNRLPSR